MANIIRFIKNVYIRLYKLVLGSVYELAAFFMKHDRKKVVIALSRTDTLEGNLKFIYDELKVQAPEAEIHFVESGNKMNLSLFQEIFMISNARYLILDDYYLPIYLIKPKKELKVIQLWHAAGAFKKFGHSTVGTRFGPDEAYLNLVPIHSNYTNVYISSTRFRRFYAEAFHMSPDTIYAYGLPRADLFHNKQMCHEVKNKLFNEYPELKDEHVVNIMVAPTYRAKSSYAESSVDFISYMLKWCRSLKTNIRIIFKAHPYVSERDLSALKACPNVLLADKYAINEWMLLSDAFITDYSSAIFEFALLNRPLAHFIPDFDAYQLNRGLYQRIEDMSDAVILKDESQLVHWMNARKKKDFFDTSNMIGYNFDYTENVSGKIVNHFISET